MDLSGPLITQSDYIVCCTLQHSLGAVDLCVCVSETMYNLYALCVCVWCVAGLNRMSMGHVHISVRGGALSQ